MALMFLEVSDQTEPPIFSYLLLNTIHLLSSVFTMFNTVELIRKGEIFPIALNYASLMNSASI